MVMITLAIMIWISYMMIRGSGIELNLNLAGGRIYYLI